ncbi:V-type ATP synthase subunit D [Candidatus Nanohalobium constans]|uniref:A-type ATP synthase subunit D n=1 Tax=Candidatus Nanohalobium constans TaxID=2565781 RepID=A0A5Q0UGD7_9ARCH|nr:V-type ATP synthase subunit D [Candidatus Nanohalobium constans]QGA80713.1 V/A-type H+/Na+-transporting ATPase subunit D [Candidatus Nanohalobium constans]
MSQDVKPTRSEELRLKERIELAENGHEILEKKRDGLIHEFMEVIDDAKEVNQELADLYSQARLKMMLAKIYDGEDSIKANAMAEQNDPELETEAQNIMGVVVPEIESGSIQRGVFDREYGISSTSSRVDSTADKYEELLEKIVDAAETQTKILKLLNEIEKTKRRVNALEHKIIPEMQEGLDTVSQVLEERAREETFRMKKIKEMQEQ